MKEELWNDARCVIGEMLSDGEIELAMMYDDILKESEMQNEITSRFIKVGAELLNRWAEHGIQKAKCALEITPGLAMQFDQNKRFMS